MKESATISAGASTRQATARAVPFLDLGRIHAGLKDDLLDDFAQLIDAGSFINGPAVAAFEAAFAAYCGSRYAVGVASGTDALRLALLASGVRPGDEVIVPALTFVATLEAVTQAGARPVVVDVLEGDATIDPAGVEATIGARTSAVIPVHLYGHLAGMRRLEEVTRAHSVQIVEDACQAHGAVADGVRPGELGRAAAFSFYPGKNLGAFGDAGAITTDDEGLAEHVTALR